MDPSRIPHATRWLVFALVAVSLAGCMSPDGEPKDPADPPDGSAPNGSGPDGGAPGGGPYETLSPDHQLHFDGTAAYDLALTQMYDDPDAKTGPRYRIPGTDDHAEVAELLRDELAAALQPIDGQVHTTTFTGTAYYELDLRPVAAYTCDPGDADRDRVRDLSFTNIIGQTQPDEWGMIIGAHWDSKRHALGSDEPILAGDDGAASTAAVIELARALATSWSRQPPDEGIPAVTFALFDGEDGFEDCHPLAGSMHMAQTEVGKNGPETAQGLILLDMVGNTSAQFYRLDSSERYRTQDGMMVDSTSLTLQVWQSAEKLKVDNFVDETIRGVLDDHIPFLEQGIPATDIIRYDGRFAPYWHTTRDDHTSFSAEGLERVGRVVEQVLLEYADACGAPCTNELPEPPLAASPARGTA